MEKPIFCPFCGSTNLAVSTVSDTVNGSAPTVKCNDCGARGPVAFDTKLAIRRWNHRCEHGVPLG